MKKTLLANGAKPEEVDSIFQDIKREAQAKMIEEYKKELKLKVQSLSRLQKSQDTKQPNVEPSLKKGPA